MRLKKVRIVVEPFSKLDARWKEALRGKRRTKNWEETISVGSWEILGKVLSPPRLQILALIPVVKPRSIAHLAKAMHKDFKNIHSDVHFLADLGLINLHEEGKRKTLIPVAKFSGIELPLAA